TASVKLLRRASYQLPFRVFPALKFPGLYAMRYEDWATFTPRTTVRFRYTRYPSGVPFWLVVRFTRKANDVEGGAWYGSTDPFANAMVGLAISGKLRSSNDWPCARRACVDIPAARRMATRKTTSAFPANRFSFRSPSQYGTTKMPMGIRRTTRQKTVLRLRTYSWATTAPSRSRYVIRNQRVARNFWNHFLKEARSSSRFTSSGDAGG